MVTGKLDVHEAAARLPEDLEEPLGTLASGTAEEEKRRELVDGEAALSVS